MTLGTTPPVEDYLENGVTLIHAIPFQFQAATEIVCTRIAAATGIEGAPLVQGADYTVTGGGGGTGSVTKTNGGNIGDTFRIKRFTGRAQPTDLIAHDSLPADVLEVSLDRGAAVNQEQDVRSDQIAADLDLVEGRALRVPPGEVIPALPAAAARADKFMQFGATGGTVNLLTSVALVMAILPSLLGALGPAYKGDPGGNIMAIGRFTAAPGLNIPVGTELVQTSGYSTLGKGVALYVSDAAVDAAFAAANPRWAFVSANGRGFRLDAERENVIEAFGAVGDATKVVVGTDDYPAVAAAKAFQEYFRTAPSSNTDYRSVPAVRFTARGYRSSQTWNLDRASYRLFGTGHNFNGYGGTYIYFDANQPMVVLQNWSTAGLLFDQAASFVVHAPGTEPRGASDSYLADITFVSRGGTVGNPDHTGIIQRCAAVLDRVHVFDAGGYGIAVVADVSVGSNANASNSADCGAQRCGLSGWYDHGGDANACRQFGFQAFSNQGYGIEATNFLGNAYRYFQTDGNGTLGSGPSWSPRNVSTFTNFGGRKWRVTPGAHVAAATTQPGTNAAVWIDLGAGSTGLGPNWVNGANTYCSGGAFYASGANARNVFEGYAESNQADPWGDSTTSVAAFGLAQFVQSGAFLGISNGAVISRRIGARNPGATPGRFITSYWGGTPASAQPIDGVFQNMFAMIGNDASGATPWSWHCSDTNVLSDLYAGGGAPSHLRNPPGVGNAGYEFPRGINVTTSVKVNGTAVVGTQKVGWTAATGAPARGAYAAAAAGVASAAYVQAEAQGALNRIAALEARLIALEADIRSHGLIN